ncbi:phytanoyl-CoA dioxygenase family protein [Streptomonospora litoralis]|uniref:Phytanoyl-CoA dioxygenase n=1 Tax=Streptomonospora litoralis TaxID=2498135 RepID=A0A4V0ZJQ8_9ACTN|nr:phytanoyl-CoA dioxygenase family protein [Streptomonospora litoralis]QBI54332.1 hypothetical protein EKD16_12750 [Streptomonospora litoralis]
MLTDDQVEDFVRDGFVRLPRAVPRPVADQCRAELWQATGCDPDDPATWTDPVVRIPGLSTRPFREAANTPELHAAYDRLAGKGRWQAPPGLGTFPVRFPSREAPGDDGWHLDASGVTDERGGPRVTLRSHGRALLMLFLFSEVTEVDAPTRIRLGSHFDVPPLLADSPEETGRDWLELCGQAVPAGADRPERLATGRPGDVFLCHPFLIHAAQPHRGAAPRFIAQPPLVPTGPLELESAAPTPVERAVREALGCG